MAAFCVRPAALQLEFESASIPFSLFLYIPPFVCFCMFCIWFLEIVRRRSCDRLLQRAIDCPSDWLIEEAPLSLFFCWFPPWRFVHFVPFLKEKFRILFFSIRFRDENGPGEFQSSRAPIYDFFFFFSFPTSSSPFASARFSQVTGPRSLFKWLFVRAVESNEESPWSSRKSPSRWCDRDVVFPSRWTSFACSLTYWPSLFLPAHLYGPEQREEKKKKFVRCPPYTCRWKIKFGRQNVFTLVNLCRITSPRPPVRTKVVKRRAIAQFDDVAFFFFPLVRPFLFTNHGWPSCFKLLLARLSLSVGSAKWSRNQSILDNK